MEECFTRQDRMFSILPTINVVGRLRGWVSLVSCFPHEAILLLCRVPSGGLRIMAFVLSTKRPSAS